MRCAPAWRRAESRRRCGRPPRSASRRSAPPKTSRSKRRKRPRRPSPPQGPRPAGSSGADPRATVNDYSIREVQRTLGLSRGMILGLVKSGYVTPELGPRRAYRFTFRDLVVMRTAQELIAAKIPPRRVAQTLKRLRAQLPGELPLGGLRIRAAGDRIVVQD